MRLIDADALKDTLLKYNYTTAHNQIFRYIDEQPTAYDVDKVVEELEKLADASNDHMYESYFDGKEDGIREAIAIVKQEAEQYNNGLYSNNRKGN